MRLLSIFNIIWNIFFQKIVNLTILINFKSYIQRILDLIVWYFILVQGLMVHVLYLNLIIIY